MKYVLIALLMPSFFILEACKDSGSLGEAERGDADTDISTEADTGTGDDTDTGTAGYSPCPTDGSACEIMPVGDSITYGVGSSTGEGGYRIPLFQKSLADGKNLTFVGRQTNGPTEVDGVSFPRNHEGYSGISVDELIAQQIQGALAANIPHIFLLMIGTNDITWKGAEGVSDELAQLLDILTDAAPDALVVVAQITPLGWTSTDLLNYNSDMSTIVSDREAQGKHLVLVDMYTGFPGNGLDSSDGVHPNDIGYQFMADQWYAAIQDHLR